MSIVILRGLVNFTETFEIFVNAALVKIVSLLWENFRNSTKMGLCENISPRHGWILASILYYLLIYMKYTIWLVGLKFHLLICPSRCVSIKVSCSKFWIQNLQYDKSFKTLSHCPVISSFEQGGIFIVPRLMWQENSGFFLRSHSKTVPFQSPLTTSKRGDWWRN